MEQKEQTQGIDVVYPIKQFGSRWKDNELRYSLRSIEMYLHGFRNVYIIGYKPEFIKGVTQIDSADPDIIPDNNILSKILQACDIPELSQQFLFMNDDHYLLDHFDAETFPYYYFVTLSDYCKRRGADGYGLRARNTLAYLKANNLPDKHFDIHFPILYDKTKCKEVFGKLPKNDTGYILKSIYANSLKIEGEYNRDCKHTTVPPAKYTCFSTMPQVSGALYRFFEYRFPKKSSRFEI